MLVSAEKSERLPAISSAASDGLPVVELKPFTQKQWRPAHSLPTAYNYTSRTAYSVGMTPRRSRWYPESSSVVVSPRDPPEQEPTTRRSQNHPRTRDLHLGGQQPQAFVPKLEREKTTTLDIRSSCAPVRNLPETKPSMLVHGRKMDKLPSRPDSIYAPPWDYYQSSREPSVAVPGVSSANTPQPVAVPGVSSVNTPQPVDRELAYVYLDETIYDDFDRSHTLPSINVVPMRRRRRRGRRPQREPSPGSGGSSRRNSGRRSRQEAYRLGVANALDVFSRFGQPLFVERQISFQLKNTMRRLRRNRDTSPVSSAGQSQPSTERFDTSIVPTVGEAMIRAGWMMNAGRLPRGYNPLEDTEEDGDQSLPVFGEYSGFDQPILGRTSVQSPRKRLTSDRKRNAVNDTERKMPNITELDRKRNIEIDTKKSSPEEFNQNTVAGQPDDVQESALSVVDPPVERPLQEELSVPMASPVTTPMRRTGTDVHSDSSLVADQDSENRDMRGNVIDGTSDVTQPEQETDAGNEGENDETEVRSKHSENVDKDSEIATNVSDNN